MGKIYRKENTRDVRLSVSFGGFDSSDWNQIWKPSDGMFSTFEKKGFVPGFLDSVRLGFGVTLERLFRREPIRSESFG